MTTDRRPARPLVEEIEVSRREVTRRCTALAIARVALVVALASLAYSWPVIWGCPGDDMARPPGSVRVTLAGYSVASLALLVLVRRSRSMKRISQLSIGIDLAAVSVLTVLSGGTDSQLVPIYMLIIVGAAVLLSPVSGMTAAIVSVSLLSLTYLGQTVGWVARCSEVNDAQGGVFRFVAVVSFLVLTAFLAAYLALNSSRLKFLNVEILESMNAGVAIVDLDANVQYLNSMGCRLLGQNPLAVRGAAVDRVFPGPAGAAIRSTLKTGVPASRMEVTLKTDQGADTPAGITTSVLSDRRRHIWGVAASFSDLSEVKRIEERLRHADRMETIAHSAAGMGHELRNPLACIRGGVDLLTEILPVGGEVAEVMELVARETQRLSTIVESFLDVSRVSSPVCAEHTFGEIWSEVESVLHAKFGGVLLTKVRLVLTPGSEEVVCWADLGQIRQVLINLTQNALEALADVGSIRVSCQYRRVDETAASTAGVEVFVTDDGPGVPRGFENRVFEPFYTSKARGTGLGLAVVKRIIEGHGGEVRLLTTLGPGTTFHFWLPPKGCGG